MAVQVWNDGQFTGKHTVTLGYGDYADVTSATSMPNDSITSVKVAPFTRVQFWADPHFSGKTIIIDGPLGVPLLKNYGSVNLNDEITSARVTRLEPSTGVKLQCCNGQKPSGECAEFVPGTITCDGAIAAYCTGAGGLNDEYCKSWCRSNPTVCDNAVIAWCASHPSDPYCTCVRSRASSVGANPKCVDRDCIVSGYQTSSMRLAQCPNIIDCTLKLAIENSGVNIGTTIPVQQNCGNTTVVDASGKIVPTTGTNTQTTVTMPTSAADSAFSRNITIALIVFVVILLLVALGVAVWWALADETPERVNE